ncbi:sulfurtransferase TusA family protein [Telmatospirillum sp. J64-1]|uniref:sulfurtransferase TusA family protein n=1 Tax=Telmatospirillum sp. J64-1 TaxID=2502183 RepID=UPI00115EA7ED|nr:sulfurtransferase TusA family protein [Telmatospirillum sp. J64-1]
MRTIPQHPEPEIAEEWDAGTMGCGELLLELRNRLKQIPGRTIKLVALDPGAPEDIPAWCRLTRNELLRHEPETGAFWIRSRSEW